MTSRIGSCLFGISRQNFDRADLGGAALAGEADVQDSIAGWGHIAKDALIGNILSHCVGIDIKSGQNDIPVDPDGERSLAVVLSRRKSRK